MNLETSSIKKQLAVMVKIGITKTNENKINKWMNIEGKPRTTRNPPDHPIEIHIATTMSTYISQQASEEAQKGKHKSFFPSHTWIGGNKNMSQLTFSVIRSWSWPRLVGFT